MKKNKYSVFYNHTSAIHNLDSEEEAIQIIHFEMGDSNWNESVVIHCNGGIYYYLSQECVDLDLDGSRAYACISVNNE